MTRSSSARRPHRSTRTAPAVDQYTEAVLLEHGAATLRDAGISATSIDSLLRDPHGRRAFRDLIAATQSGDLEARDRAGDRMTKILGPIIAREQLAALRASVHN